MRCNGSCWGPSLTIFLGLFLKGPQGETKIARAGDAGFARAAQPRHPTALADKVLRNTTQTHSTSVASIPGLRSKMCLSVCSVPSGWVYRGC